MDKRGKPLFVNVPPSNGVKFWQASLRSVTPSHKYLLTPKPDLKGFVDRIQRKDVILNSPEASADVKYQCHCLHCSPTSSPSKHAKGCARREKQKHSTSSSHASSALLPYISPTSSKTSSTRARQPRPRASLFDFGMSTSLRNSATHNSARVGDMHATLTQSQQRVSPPHPATPPQAHSGGVRSPNAHPGPSLGPRLKVTMDGRFAKTQSPVQYIPNTDAPVYVRGGAQAFSLSGSVPAQQAPPSQARLVLLQYGPHHNGSGQSTAVQGRATANRVQNGGMSLVDGRNGVLVHPLNRVGAAGQPAMIIPPSLSLRDKMHNARVAAVPVTQGWGGATGHWGVAGGRWGGASTTGGGAYYGGAPTAGGGAYSMGTPVFPVAPPSRGTRLAPSHMGPGSGHGVQQRHAVTAVPGRYPGQHNSVSHYSQPMRGTPGSNQGSSSTAAPTNGRGGQLLMNPARPAVFSFGEPTLSQVRREQHARQEVAEWREWQGYVSDKDKLRRMVQQQETEDALARQRLLHMQMDGWDSELARQTLLREQRRRQREAERLRRLEEQKERDRLERARRAKEKAAAEAKAEEERRQQELREERLQQVRALELRLRTEMKRSLESPRSPTNDTDFENPMSPTGEGSFGDMFAVSRDRRVMRQATNLNPEQSFFKLLTVDHIREGLQQREMLAMLRHYDKKNRGFLYTKGSSLAMLARHLRQKYVTEFKQCMMQNHIPAPGTFRSSSAFFDAELETVLKQHLPGHGMNTKTGTQFFHRMLASRLDTRKTGRVRMDNLAFRFNGLLADIFDFSTYLHRMRIERANLQLEINAAQEKNSTVENPIK